MRAMLEIDCDRPQSALLETQQDARTKFLARPADDGVVVHLRGQHRYGWCH